MPHLLSQFDLKPDVPRARFQAAWSDFVRCLVDMDLAVSGGPLHVRQPQSGYDTDAERGQSLMTLITFRDQAQADAAWAAIEGRHPTLGPRHRTALSLVHDPVFTFWAET